MSLTSFNSIKAAEIQLELDKLWRDPQFDKAYKPRANAVIAVLENQTATIVDLEKTDSKRDVKVKWVDFCGDTSADGADADDCDTPIGAEGEAKTKTYALDTFITDSFSVASEELESVSATDYDRIVTLGIAAKTKNIIEAFDKKVIAAIDANKGDNPFTAGQYVPDNVGDSTPIPASEFGADKLIPYLMQVAEYNRGGSPFALDGGNLFQDYYKAPKNALNADGKLANALYEDLPYYHDLVGMANAGQANTTYLIDRGALMIANRAKFTSPNALAQQKNNGEIKTTTGTFFRTTWEINIPSLKQISMISKRQLFKQSLILDVQYGTVCKADGTLLNTWFLKLRTGVFANPLRCDVNNTGIMKFTKVDG